MKIFISLGYSQEYYGEDGFYSFEKHLNHLNEMIVRIRNATKYPNIGMHEFLLGITQYLYKEQRGSGSLKDVDLGALNAAEIAEKDHKQYPSKRTYSQELSYQAFTKLMQEFKKAKPLKISDKSRYKVAEPKKQLAFYSRLLKLHSLAEKLSTLNFDPNSNSWPHTWVREALDAEGIDYTRKEQ